MADRVSGKKKATEGTTQSIKIARKWHLTKGHAKYYRYKLLHETEKKKEPDSLLKSLFAIGSTAEATNPGHSERPSHTPERTGPTPKNGVVHLGRGTIRQGANYPCVGKPLVLECMRGKNS